VGEFVGILVLREADAVGSHDGFGVGDEVGDVVGVKLVVVVAVIFFSSLAYEVVVVVVVVEVDVTDGDVDVGFVVVVVIVVL
jgi:hypothetical protein